MHLSDGTLRRWVDEPFTLDPPARRHLDTCPRCGRRAEEIRSDRDLAMAVVAAQPLPPPDRDRALARLRARLADAGSGVRRRAGRSSDRHRASRVARWLSDPRRGARIARRYSSVVGATALVAVLVGAGVASGFITIFQPRQFAPVAVSISDLSSLQELASYGDVSGVPGLTFTPGSWDQARSATGVSLPQHVTLPSGIPSTPGYAVLSGGTISFTFDLSKAEAAARQVGATLPPMPAGMNGSTLRLTVPSAFVETYGFDAGLLLGGAASVPGESQAGSMTAIAASSSAGPAGSPAPGTAPPVSAIPGLSQGALAIVACRLPSVASNGATAAEIEDYLLAQPAIPAGLADEIRAIGDPSQTLPVPVPISFASAQTVSIDGATGLLVGDQTGVGSVVVWQHGGVVYAVLGTVSASEVLGVADQVG